MHIAMFYQSLISDWNHGNAHFLRGLVTELLARGYQVDVYEPVDSWSFENLLEQQGMRAIAEFHAVYPHLKSHRYQREQLDLETVLDNVDLVLVHEWNDPTLIQDLGYHRRRAKHLKLLFHDTHHRLATQQPTRLPLDLDDYDGVLAYGKVITDKYRHNGWARQSWTWHEAADTRLFKPLPGVARTKDLVWIGNWGDEERTKELYEFLIAPARQLELTASAYGVRYPDHGRAALAQAGINYCGWLPNYKVPEVFARYKVTVHILRRPYVTSLPGIPTIRPFEALACGIPLVCSRWEDSEHLFTVGRDFLMARNAAEMQSCLRDVINDPDLAAALAANGRATILEKHTCAHRVDELLKIYSEMTTPQESALATV